MLAEDVDELLFDILRLNPAHCLAFTTPVVTIRSNWNSNQGFQWLISWSSLLWSSKGSRLLYHNNDRTSQWSLLRMFLSMSQMKKSSICASHTAVLWRTRFITRCSATHAIGTSTRFVDMELNEYSSFNTFYWMKGPIPGDQGRRVLVLHSR